MDFSGREGESWKAAWFVPRVFTLTKYNSWVSKEKDPLQLG
jgi:hypothetical protein